VIPLFNHLLTDFLSAYFWTLSFTQSSPYLSKWQRRLILKWRLKGRAFFVELCFLHLAHSVTDHDSQYAEGTEPERGDRCHRRIDDGAASPSTSLEVSTLPVVRLASLPFRLDPRMCSRKNPRTRKRNTSAHQVLLFIRVAVSCCGWKSQNSLARWQFSSENQGFIRIGLAIPTPPNSRTTMWLLHTFQYWWKGIFCSYRPKLLSVSLKLF
jgi:hypothetical protein